MKVVEAREPLWERGKPVLLLLLPPVCSALPLLPSPLLPPPLMPMLSRWLLLMTMLRLLLVLLVMLAVLLTLARPESGVKEKAPPLSAVIEDCKSVMTCSRGDGLQAGGFGV